MLTCRPATNRFHGDRSRAVIDPFGHWWAVGMHVEGVLIDGMPRMQAVPGR